jgi:hypothetical protein
VLRVYSLGLPATVPNGVKAFAAGLPGPVFGAGGVRLRLLAAQPEAPAVHERLFPDRDLFDGPPVAFVWNRDHTVAFVLGWRDLTVVDALAAGFYRLTATYHKRLADPAAMVMSQAGDDTDETVAVDFVLG